MNLKINTRKRICVFYLVILINVTCGSLLDYFPLGKSLFGRSEIADENTNELSTQKVPYEVEVTDEKFIEQAARFTGVSLSDLDKCQHRVVLKLQEECHKLNDEELAKLAVKLLNCQSAIEGRKIYPCTSEMPIRDCTSSMDSDTWNSYLLMSNRARAVCYSIRQAQFRGLTELTVNKLMSAAHEQLNIMTRLKDSQFRIEQATSDTYNTVVIGNQALKRQQDDIRQAQFHGQLALEDNIRRLADEKQLILEGHEQLTEMTKDVKAKLDEAAKQLDAQSEERKDNHKEILNDLVAIQEQAQVIFARIEESSRHMLEQSVLAAKQYEATLAQLGQVNSTVYALVDVIASTRSVLEEKLKWMSEALGGTDDTVERLYLFVSHISYLILAMVSCAFLQVAVPSRVALVILVPLNLIVAIQQGTKNALSFVGLSAVLFSFIAVQTTLSLALIFWQARSMKKEALNQDQKASIEYETNEATSKEQDDYDNTTCDSPTVANSSIRDSYSYRNGYTYRTYNDTDTTDNRSEIGELDFVHPTPPLSRNGYTRSRSKTPSIFNPEKRRCHATTRMGTPCKSSVVTGRDYCYRHQLGSSVIQ